MDMLNEPLDIYFRKILPEELFHHIIESERNDSFSECFSKTVIYSNTDGRENVFYRGADVFQQKYSQDEIRLIQKRIEQNGSDSENHQNSVFSLLPQYTRKILTFRRGDPMCDKSYVFLWREISFRLGPDILTTAHRAYQDYKEGGHSTYFAWPTVIHVNNPIVQEIINQSLAENHSHLNGSVPPSILSWICLMNHPDDIQRYNENKEFQYDLMTTTHYRASEIRFPWVKRLQLAFWLRAHLFLLISGEKTRELKKGSLTNDFEIMDGRRKSEFRKLANYLRHWYGTEFTQSNGKGKVLDYAFPDHLNDTRNRGYYRLMAGERYFLYRCFYEIYAGHFSNYEQDLFYLYLLLKSRFRGEMIQINSRVGFHNFLNYQNRKDLLWDERKEYVAEGYRIAVNGKMHDQHISTQEDRFMPSNSKGELLSKITEIDKEIVFSHETMDEGADIDIAIANGEWNSESVQRKAKNYPNFYTLHFAKFSSKAKKRCGIYPPRNHEAREKSARQALALVDALIHYPYLGNRIRGIDACASEIGCRPETFATEFRFLKHFRSSCIRPDFVRLYEVPWPSLCATYHAGEDFLDLADGLRAIDEAVSFLELERGDRLGHALALGIDPKCHYAVKGNRAITTKQNRLDDLVWLICRSEEYNVQIPLSLLRKMEEEAVTLLNEIYGRMMEGEGWNLTIRDYYNGWKLRGDHPDLHDSVNFEESSGYKRQMLFGGSYHSIQSQYVKHMQKRRMAIYPKIKQLNGLLYYYHFDGDVRDIGDQACDVWITADYYEVIRAVQDTMIDDLTEKGIYVECNPSSNYLISTIQKYKEHPVFRFNQYGMHKEKEHHLCVSLNTDDMGVFDTSLENEYALIAAALDDIKDENGRKCYNDDFIFDYLNHLRMMGHRQAFVNQT